MAGERVLPGLGLRAYWTPGSNGWNAQHDPDTRLLSAVTQLSVISRVAAVPNSPTDGDIHILTAAPNQNAVAIRDNGAWVYITPQEGWRAYDRATDDLLIFSGSAWTVFSPGTVSEIGDLDDVDTSTPPTDGQVLTWVAADSAWKPAQAPGAVIPAFTTDNKTASYALVNGDLVGNKLIRMTVATANNLTVSANLTNGEPVSVVQMGTGQTTIVPDTGVTLHSSRGLKLRAQYSVATIIKIAANTYVVSGDTEV